MGWAILVPVALILALILLSTSLFTPRPQGPMTGAIAVLAVVLSLFSTLTVTVGRGWLECRFGIGLIRRRIRLSDVLHAEAVRNHWYYGWGIRYIPRGRLRNVYGLDAVELTLAGGQRFRIGTDEPRALLNAIRDAAEPAIG